MTQSIACLSLSRHATMLKWLLVVAAACVVAMDVQDGGDRTRLQDMVDRTPPLVDVSQLSKAATLQVLELTRTPIIASHSNAKTVSDVTRNLSDEEIDRIGENGGVIHVAAFKGYLINISAPEFIEKLVALRIAAGISIEYNYPFELYWEIDDLRI